MEPTDTQKALYECAKSLSHEELVSTLVDTELKAGDMAKRMLKFMEENETLKEALSIVKDENKQLQEEIEELKEEVEERTTYAVLPAEGQFMEENKKLKEQIDELGTLCENIDDNAYNTWKQITNYQEEDDK